jgi:hypothetical protein
MKRGFSSAEVIIIHTGKVIMNKGVGMDHFQGACYIEPLLNRNIIIFQSIQKEERA